MKGGHPNSGRVPDPNALRRERKDDPGWKHLPAQGRQGPPPPWPLTRPIKRELEVWAQEWRRPQALEWEANHQEREVALYVRWLVKSEKPNAPIGLGTLVKQLQEALGLSLPGLMRNRWIIANTADAAQRPVAIEGGSTKDRLKSG